MEKAPTKIYFSAHPALPTRVKYHQTVVLFTKESLD